MIDYNCDKCKFKMHCNMLDKHISIPILVECNLLDDCFRLNRDGNKYTGNRVKNGAKLLKKILQYKFPQHKWKVRGNHFSMGNSIDASFYDNNMKYKDENGKYIEHVYTEAMKEEDRQIDNICNMFEQGKVNGMTDSYDYSDNPSLLMSTKYCSANRKAYDYPY